LLPAETYYPKPSIFLRPRSGVALGAAVTVRCRGRHQDVRFLLYKVGNPNALQDAAPAGDVAEFPIRNVSRGDAGSYNCRYSTKSDPPVWSEPSDPAVLVVAGEGPGSASPGGLTLVGHSETHRGSLGQWDPQTRGIPAPKRLGVSLNLPVPPFPLVSMGDNSPSSPFLCVCAALSPSDSQPPPDLNATGLRYPKPSISLQPSGGVALGGAVTVRCRGRHQSVRFLLYKDGNRTVLQEAEPTRNVAEFPIRDVSRRHGGKYLCYYRSKSDPPVWSHPSDPVELVVAGEGPGSASPLPAPPPAGPSEGLSTDGTLRARLSPEGKGGAVGAGPCWAQGGWGYNPLPLAPDLLDGGGGLGAPLPGQGQLLISPSEPPSDSPLPPTAAPPGRPGFIHANIARLALSAAVLLVLGLILAEAYYSRLRGEP
uniref:Ig-like domain-containing protein n=1 Tax=Chelydra serpentina TaxID=8475 RepID=A0A8C3SUJ6_CHESE